MKVGRVIDQDFKIWKGKTSMVLLVLGCNMQCPFCSKGKFAKNALPCIDWEPSFDRVKRAIEGVVITGGEPLVQDHLSIFCKKMKLSGIAVRIETNGSKPELLNELFKRRVVDSIALDVKAPLNDYARVTKSNVNAMRIKESIGILKNRGIDYELRTTWSPDMTREQILETAKLCSGSPWILQGFEPGGCLDPAYDSKESTPYNILRETAIEAEGPTEVRIRSEKGEEKVR